MAKVPSGADLPSRTTAAVFSGVITRSETSARARPLALTTLPLSVDVAAELPLRRQPESRLAATRPQRGPDSADRLAEAAADAAVILLAGSITGC